MWEYGYSAETTASPQALWRRWSDMAAWPQWNAGIEKMEIDGPFAVGTTFTMTPPGEDPIRMRLVEMGPAELLPAEADGAEFFVRTGHRLGALPPGRRGA